MTKVVSTGVVAQFARKLLLERWKARGDLPAALGHRDRMFGDMRRLYAWREQLQAVSCSVKGGPLDFYIPLDAQLPETKGGASCSSKSMCVCVCARG